MWLCQTGAQGGHLLKISGNRKRQLRFRPEPVKQDDRLITSAGGSSDCLWPRRFALCYQFHRPLAVFSFPCRHFVPGKRKKGLISRSLLSPRRLSQADRNCQSGRHIMLLPGISGQAPETEVYVSVENRDLSEGPPVTKVISGFGEASANIVTTESFVTSRF